MKIPSYLFKKKVSGVYVIQHKDSGKKYIGSSLDMYNRLHKHNSLLNHGKHQNCYLQNAWKKYGGDAFHCYVVELCNTDLTRSEQQWIDELLPEYNLTQKVIRNQLSTESCTKISNTLKRKYKSGEISPTRRRCIKVYNLKGEFLQEFLSISDAARSLGIHNTSIERVLSGKYTQCKQFQFKYSEDPKKMGTPETGKYVGKYKVKPVPG